MSVRLVPIRLLWRAQSVGAVARLNMSSSSSAHAENHPIKNVTVIGSGLMGAGIAQVSAQAQLNVVVVDQSDEILSKAKRSFQQSLLRVAKKKFPDDQKASEAFTSDTMARVTMTTNIKEAVSKADLVVEAIVENLAVKQRLFAEVESAAPSSGPSLTEEAYAKLSNSDASFAFDTTAAYFMCWMTKKRLPLFRHPPFCAYPEQLTNFPELYGLDPRNYPIHINRDHVLLDRFDPVAWRCAEISFCPDPCCGRENIFEGDTNTSDSVGCTPAPQSCANDDGVAEIARCRVPPSANSNLRAMIANEWNTSCACARSGFVYNTDSGMCVDEDECSELPSPCFDEHERCINAVGSYVCVCELGYERVTGADGCRPIDANVDSLVWHGPAVDGARSLYPSPRLLVCVLFALICCRRVAGVKLAHSLPSQVNTC
uniref:EGF-like domain-containing protein n=1 Tax=Plectus sambesii TaxID=2011161 RepID=A0A914VWY0_9BILA